MKRKRGDSAEVAIQAHINAAKGPIQVPGHVTLRPGDEPFWEGIVRARARDEWIDADLVVAAQLARCQRDIEVESQALDLEGSTIKNDRGTMVANPRFTVLQQLAQREMALMRTLRMGGKVAGDPRSEAGARAAQRQAENIRNELKETSDDLLAA
jgi:hypothetical protein